jgi:type II secretory ATPase GspE/PulE/Tfp pilus assembly ATPase PilB-like protein
MDADKRVDQIFAEALALRASDVHFEPHADGCHVLFRIDGLLQEQEVFDSEQLQRVVSRLKVIAGLPVYERDMALDGHLEIADGDLPIQARIAILPTIHGEKAVVRLFRRDDCAMNLPGLGLPEEVRTDLRRIIHQRQGVLLLTGPSGCGKTTTIYALLEEIHRESRGETNIVTLEDPVERDLGFAAQTPLSRCRNLSMAETFRHILRQDPEVIVVGEIRDPETAQIAVRAGLTGHLVISTVHSRDTTEVFLRLLEMGVEGYLVGSALAGVVAQRLLRRLCDSCKEEIAVPENVRAHLGVEPATPLFGPVGCPECSHLGYRGRTAIAECLTLTDDLRLMIHARTEPVLLRRAARECLSLDLAESASRALSEGLTSPAEVFRVLPNLEREEFAHA